MDMLFVGIMGLIAGSFFGVCIMRYPGSIVQPPSHCQSCKSMLRWYDLIPVVSYLMLRGRCRYCCTPIPITCPVIEILTSVLAVGLLWRYNLGLEFLALAGLCGILLIAAGIDARHGVLPDFLTIPGTLLAIPVSAVILHNGFINAIGGACLGAGFLLLIRQSYAVLHGTPGLGLGDVKLMGMIGAVVGIYGTPAVLLLASLGALLWAYLSHTRKLSFGPWLSLACVLVILIR